MRRVRRPDPRSTGEEGFSLVELLVVMLVMSIVSAIVMAAMVSYTRSTAAAEARTRALSDVRLAVETISRDLRAANPIDAVTPVSSYDGQVQFSIYCANAGVGQCGSNNLRQVRYRYDAASRTLFREIQGTTSPLLGPQDTATLALDKRLGAIVNGANQPIFQYYDREGNRFATSTGNAPPATTFRDCARVVRIHLVVRSEANTDATVDLTTDVALRNYNEVDGC